MTELKPCPFCGGEAKLEVHRNGACQYDFSEIYCVKCEVRICKKIDVEYAALDECIKVWNRRESE